MDMTTGSTWKLLLSFAVPLLIGNLFQQLYNTVDSIVVGRYVGDNALAAVGSASPILNLLLVLFIGISMGASIMVSQYFGSRDRENLSRTIGSVLTLTAASAVFLMIVGSVAIRPILELLNTPASIIDWCSDYLFIMMYGIAGVAYYNILCGVLRGLGDSFSALVYLVVATVINIVLDLWFVIGLDAGIAGAAVATVISQWISGIGIAVYTWGRCPQFRLRRRDFRITKETFGEIFQFSFLTCVQQSVMNLGILMVQGLVNSFGPVVMAAFAAAVKIDSFAYMPVQDFGNAFSTFVAQNYGAGKQERIREGARKSVLLVLGFCLVISASVFVFAKQLLLIFVQPYETEILAVGIQYLRIEGVFYFGIGFLFLFYGYYRAVRKPGMSVVLTVISLGTRVVLAYVLSAVPQIGVSGIWSAVPIGWILADIAGWIYYKKLQQR